MLYIWLLTCRCKGLAETRGQAWHEESQCVAAADRFNEQPQRAQRRRTQRGATSGTRLDFSICCLHGKVYLSAWAVMWPINSLLQPQRFWRVASSEVLPVGARLNYCICCLSSKFHSSERALI